MRRRSRMNAVAAHSPASRCEASSSDTMKAGTLPTESPRNNFWSRARHHTGPRDGRGPSRVLSVGLPDPLFIHALAIAAGAPSNPQPMSLPPGRVRRQQATSCTSASRPPPVNGSNQRNDLRRGVATTTLYRRWRSIYNLTMARHAHHCPLRYCLNATALKPRA